jgi:predicted secreted Zn-dependent protease
MRELGAIAVALLTTSTPDAPPPEIHETTTFYDVAGRTADELRDAMNRGGPLGSDGSHQDAFASWKVHYTYQTAAGAGGCSLKRLRVDADITSILPRWVDKPATSSGLTDRWDKHVAALEANLEGIRDIGRRAAAGLRDSLWKIPGQPRCEALDDRIGTTADAVLQQHVRETEEYDAAARNDPAKAARFP